MEFPKLYWTSYLKVSESFLARFTSNKQNSLLPYVTYAHSRVELAVGWVACNWWKPSKTSENATVSWKIHGVSFLGWATLKREQPSTPTITLSNWGEKNHLSSRQCTVLYVMRTMAKLGFNLLRHLPYPPHLAPSDYWLFADL